MRRTLGAALAILVLGGCATAVDMNAVNSRLEDNSSRIENLEKSMTSRPALPDDTKVRIERVEEDLKALRRDFADTKVTVDGMTERFESMEAFMKEVEQYMAEFRKKGGEIDRTLENLTNKLEAEVRGFGERLKKFVESQK